MRRSPADVIARFQRAQGRDVRLPDRDRRAWPEDGPDGARAGPRHRATLRTKCPTISRRCATSLNVAMTLSCAPPSRAITAPARPSGRRWRPTATSTSAATRAGTRSATKPFTTRASWSTGKGGRSSRRRARRSNGPWRKAGSSGCRLPGPAARALSRPSPASSGPKAAATRCCASSRAGCSDLSVSRTSFDWGVPVPGSPAMSCTSGSTR